MSHILGEKNHIYLTAKVIDLDLKPISMPVESEPEEAAVVSTKTLTRGHNLPEEVLVLHQT